MEYLTLFILFFIGASIFALRIWITFHNPSNKYTDCPNCGKQRFAVPKGNYKCDTCGAKFAVGTEGLADLPTKTVLYCGMCFGPLLSSLTLWEIIIENKNFPDLRLILCFFAGIIMFIFSIRDLIKHKSRYGSNI